MGGLISYPKLEDIVNSLTENHVDSNDNTLCLLSSTEKSSCKTTEDETEKQDKPKTQKQGDFALEYDAVYRIVEKDGKEEQIFICSRLEVVALVRNENSEGWGRLLRFKDPDCVIHMFAIPMKMLAGNGTELRAILLDYGLRITPGKHRNDLGVYIQLWKTDKSLIAVEKTGWYREAYVLPEKIIGKNADELVYQTDNVKGRTFDQSGTVEQWQKEVARLCIGNSRLIVSVCIAFAAPLLSLTGEDGGGIQWTGGSSTGKTTLLRAACSVCASWNYKITWKSTDNGLEGVAESRNDALLILDELAEIDSRVAGKVAYMLANGQGKQRANRSGDAKGVKKWKLLFLSSGEVSLASHMSESGGKVKAGQEVRMVDIPVDAGKELGCFENLHGCLDGSVFADKISNMTSQYYGTPIIAFLENICDTGIGEFASVVRKRVGELATDWCPEGSEGQVKRVAKRFALIAVAGEFASSITGWGDGTAIDAAKRCFGDFINARGGCRNAEAESAKNKLFSFIERYGQSRFQNLSRVGSGQVHNRAGFVEIVDSVINYYLLPTAMQEIYKGETLSRVTEILAADGTIKTKEGKLFVKFYPVWEELGATTFL